MKKTTCIYFIDGTISFCYATRAYICIYCVCMCVCLTNANAKTLHRRINFIEYYMPLYVSNGIIVPAFPEHARSTDCILRNFYKSITVKRRSKQKRIMCFVLLAKFFFLSSQNKLRSYRFDAILFVHICLYMLYIRWIFNHCLLLTFFVMVCLREFHSKF